MIDIHLDRFGRNKELVLTHLRGGDAGHARHYLLLCVKSLLEAAQRSTPELRALWFERALRLDQAARRLGVAAEDAPAPEAAPGPTSETAVETPWLVSEKPRVRFEDVAGLDDVKAAIDLRVILPLKHTEIAGRFRKRPGGGLLLYGPPGVGKTLIAKAVATELDAQFLCVSCANTMSQWVGVSEQNVAKIFEAARRHPLSVIFLDEAEALVGKRGGHSTVMNRVIPEFLSQVDGLHTQKTCILLMGATNRPWDMDEAALRPGRFSEKFYIGLPDAAARARILETNLAGVPMESDVDLTALAEALDGYSGADVVAVCVKATDFPFQRQIRSGADALVTVADLGSARREVKPTVDASMLERYRRFAEGR